MESLLVADSFRVRERDGRAEVRGLEQHLARFAHAVRAAGSEYDLTTADLDSFLDSSRKSIAAYGEGFPRLEFRADGRFACRLRALPELTRSIDARSFASERVAHADRKGPNIERYARANRSVGAEALLLGADGRVLEGTTTSVLWWERGEMHVSTARTRVPSVVEALLCSAASEAGFAVVAGSLSAPELAQREAWAVNALHGIRTIASIDGVPLPAPDPDRLHRFREALDTTWQPVRPEHSNGAGL